MEKRGIITARTCPRCGHHEIGYTTRDGNFHPLQPGMMIEVLDPSGKPDSTLPPTPDPYPAGLMKDPGGDVLQGSEPIPPGKDFRSYSPWCPEEIRGEARLRKKYGILVPSDTAIDEISPEKYRMVYLEKLRYLIEKEIFVPIAVLLDRYFTAPHLASGTPKQISEAMWNELSEVQEPVNRMSDWLIHGDEESFVRLIHPLSKAELGNEPIDDHGLKLELEGLTLEEFLELL
ncbi:MAG: hypothetical protein JRH13_10465 [Deltaproteobacteria bacterium]|nr:hypothetical protein [Deltaproteobacteria bacterium]MBW2015628.1 hypothetical protein [Deltaproteobacteria bacterium]MBW2129773.1 hypothetical protein [Deltaproteobacteria bacterium]MBW2302489.1 hypothetical protein [Deltaproteobacteria bacterium]